MSVNDGSMHPVKDVEAVHSIHHFGVNRISFSVKKIYGTLDESVVTKVAN